MIQLIRMKRGSGLHIQPAPGSLANCFRRNFAIGLLAFLFMAVSCNKNATDVIPPWYPETNDNGDPLLGVFESRVPCSDCERLKFALAIYKNQQTNLPSTYIMSRVYVGRDENRISNSGNVSVTNGTSIDPLHIVYNLTSGAPEEFESFWKVDDNLLFILDSNLAPRLGDSGYGYVLNRVR